MPSLLITGAAGFIGMHLSRRLAAEGFDVTGIDNINAYYDTRLKYDRLSQLGIARDDISYNRTLQGVPNFRFVQLDITDAGNLMTLFATRTFDYVIHLAAQAGVRYSITNPRDYIDANITGFFNMLEACRQYMPKHFIFASSSSVYGNSQNTPFRTTQPTDQPVSLYAATKKSNELMAHTYSHLYGIPTTGLRFFTVYGPWGRPDMAYYTFARNILAGQPIALYNNGNLRRDFTYVDDIVESITRLVTLPPQTANADNAPQVPIRLLNIGNQNPVALHDFVAILEKHLGKKAIIEYRPMQPGDVYQTFADTRDIEALTGFRPSTTLEEGLKHFVDWMASS